MSIKRILHKTLGIKSPSREYAKYLEGNNMEIKDLKERVVRQRRIIEELLAAEFETSDRILNFNNEYLSKYEAIKCKEDIEQRFKVFEDVNIYENEDTTANNGYLHKRILDRMHETYKQKNADYGDSFNKSLDEFGTVAAIVRMCDKMERLKKLTLNPESRKVMDESIEDTLLDLANYAVMTSMYISQGRDY